MAIAYQSIQSASLQGDGLSTSVSFNISYVPTSVTFIQALQAGGAADVSSNVFSVTSSGSTVTVNFVAAFSYLVTVFFNTSIGVPTTYGTSPGAVEVSSVNAFVTNSPVVSGTITAEIEGHAGAILDGTAGSPSTGVLTIQGVTGGTAVPVSVNDFPATVNTNITQLNSVALGSPTDFGTAPATSTEVIGVNAEMFAGQTALAATGTSLNVDVTNIVPVSQSTSPWVVDGTLTNNNAAPAATNVGVLPAIAETAYATVTYTTGDQVLPVTDLHGALNTDLQAVGGTAVVTASAGVQMVGIEGHAGAVLDGVITADTAPPNALATLGVYNSTIPVLTTGQSVAMQTDTTGAHYVNTEGRKTTYRASSSFTPAAGDVAVLPGSATKTIRVTRVALSLSNSGSSVAIVASLIVRSSADSGGTHAAMTAVPLDSNFAAASAAPLQYTAAPTLGTPVGAVATQTMMDLNASQQSATQATLWQFSSGAGNSTLVLRGVAQQICVHVSAVVATQTVTVDFEWTEE
jgi:hypothetical protein